MHHNGPANPAGPSNYSFEELESVWVGYTSIVQGLPWNQEYYDTLSRAEQINYEITRLRAINIKVAGIRFPRWEFGQPYPSELAFAIRFAADLVGPCVRVSHSSLNSNS